MPASTRHSWNLVYCHPMASQRVPSILALEVEAGWKAAVAEGSPGVDPEDGRPESDLGRGAHRQRVEAEAGHPGFAPDGPEIPLSRRIPRPEARSEPAMADLDPQSRQGDRGMRFLRGGDGDHSCALRLPHRGSRETPDPSSQHHRPPDGGMDLTAVPRSATGRPSVPFCDSRPGQWPYSAMSTSDLPGSVSGGGTTGRCGADCSP